MLIDVALAKKYARIDESYDDDLVKLILKYAVEQCAKFTGYVISNCRREREIVHIRGNRITLNYVPNGMVVVSIQGSKPVELLPEGRFAYINADSKTNYITNPFTCDPEAVNHKNKQAVVTYEVGYSRLDEVPTPLVMGCYAVLAWAYEHRGDEAITKGNNINYTAGTSNFGLLNHNTLSASGAMEHWRAFMPTVRM